MNEYENILDKFGISDLDELMKILTGAVQSYENSDYSGMTESCECIYCHKTTWKELDLADFVAERLRDKIEQKQNKE